MSSPTSRASNVWQVEAADDILQIIIPKGPVISGIDSTGKGFGALANPGGGGGTPGGDNMEIQFNNNGAFGGDVNFIWDNQGVTPRFRANVGDGFVFIGAGINNGLEIDGPTAGNGVILSALETGASVTIIAAGQLQMGTPQVTILVDSSSFSLNSGGDNFLNVGATTIRMGSDNNTSNITIGTASGDKIGFYNTTPISIPTVTGSKGGNAALASLMTALAALGLVIDSTT